MSKIEEILEKIMNETDVGTIHALAMTAYEAAKVGQGDGYTCEKHQRASSVEGAKCSECYRDSLRQTSREDDLVGNGYMWCFKNDDEVLEHINMLYREYAFEDDSKLSLDAIELKNDLLSIIKRPKTPESE
jgi:hypothetical protein